MTTWILLNFVVATAFQTVAVVVAFSQIRRVKRSAFRFAWASVSLALLIMLQRRLLPIYQVLVGTFPSVPSEALLVADSILALLISALMMGGLLGLRTLFLTLEQQSMALRELAETDALTGLRNRRSMTRDALREVLRISRSGHSLSAIMLDLDHFKEINDRHGHAIGDSVLVAVSEVLRGQLRDIDLAARWGEKSSFYFFPTQIEQMQLRSRSGCEPCWRHT